MAHNISNASFRIGRWVWLMGWLAISVFFFGRSYWSEASVPRVPRELRSVKPIEEIVVGDRVVANNPVEDDVDDTFGNEVDPVTWKKIVLRSAKKDGSRVDAVLLRPQSWIEEYGVVVGRQVEIQVIECGISGMADVLAIEACPKLAGGRGRIVTGTFAHSSADILDIQVDRRVPPIGTTGSHPFWSEDQLKFVTADQLVVGEHLRTLDGTVRITSITRRATKSAVYNLEVHFDHVYHVADLGILVHNGVSLSKADFNRYNREGYRNYCLQEWDPVKKRWRTYYHGQVGPEVTEAELLARHERDHGYRPTEEGGPRRDRIVWEEGERTYGESRLMERERIIRDKTNVGRGSSNRRGNHSNGIAEERLPRYREFLRRRALLAQCP